VFDEVRIVSDIMGDYPGQWGVVGTWALPLFRKQDPWSHPTMETRRPEVDIAILRHDQHLLYTYLHDLDGWDLHYKQGNRSIPWHNEHLEIPICELRAEALLGHAPGFNIQIQDTDPDETKWLYRKNARVSLALDHLFLTNELGIPFMTPEVVLLHATENSYFWMTWDHYFSGYDPDRKRKSWLITALKWTDPDHPWLEDLIK
jgi:hypothetical protein